VILLFKTILFFLLFTSISLSANIFTEIGHETKKDSKKVCKEVKPASKSAWDKIKSGSKKTWSDSKKAFKKK